DPEVDEEHDEGSAEQVPQVQLLDVTGDGALGHVGLLARFDITVHPSAGTRRDATIERDDVVADAAGDHDIAMHDEDAAGNASPNGDAAVTDPDAAVDGAVDRDRTIGRDDRTIHHLVRSDHDPAFDADASVVTRRSLRGGTGGPAEHYERDCDERKCAEPSEVHTTPFPGSEVRSLP